MLGGIIFTLYGLVPKLVLKIFGLDPDENVIEESKKDFGAILRAFKKQP
jgi:hypothetical protein